MDSETQSNTVLCRYGTGGRRREPAQTARTSRATVKRSRNTGGPRAPPRLPLILLVDDQPEFLLSMRLLLALEGYEVVLAPDGEEGLRVARAREPAVIISDISMPRLDGISMCRRLRADPATRRIPILLTSSLDPGLPATDWDIFLKKPIEPTVLLAEIRKLLARH
jgi:CheY-like chemotaxis protein